MYRQCTNIHTKRIKQRSKTTSYARSVDKARLPEPARGWVYIVGISVRARLSPLIKPNFPRACPRCTRMRHVHCDSLPRVQAHVYIRAAINFAPANFVFGRSVGLSITCPKCMSVRVQGRRERRAVVLS